MTDLETMQLQIRLLDITEENERLWDEIERLRAALRSIAGAWSDAYPGEMAVNRAVNAAVKLLPQEGDEE